MSVHNTYYAFQQGIYSYELAYHNITVVIIHIHMMHVTIILITPFKENHHKTQQNTFVDQFI